jgi:hypothetical protein
MSFAFALAGFAALLLPMMGAMWGGALIGLLTPDAAKSHIEAWSPTLQWIAAALVMTAFLALAWSAIRRGYVHPLAPLLGTALWFAYSWGFVHFVNRWEVPPGVKDWYVRFPHPINWPMWMAVSIVPLVPFFLHPLIMARIRHR